LAITVINLIYVVSTTDIVLVLKHYIGIVLLVTSIIAAIMNNKYGILFTGATLLLGTLNFIAFNPTITYTTFWLNLNDHHLELSFQTFSFLIFILYLIINFKTLLQIIRKNETERKQPANN
jgi:hypothetical protein